MLQPGFSAMAPPAKYDLIQFFNGENADFKPRIAALEEHLAKDINNSRLGKPATCNVCGISLDDIHVSESRQVFGIPLQLVEVAEHRASEVCCSCGKMQRSDFPEWITVTSNITWVGMHTRRGQEAFDTFDILSRCQGVAFHDGRAPPTGNRTGATVRAIPISCWNL